MDKLLGCSGLCRKDTHPLSPPEPKQKGARFKYIYGSTVRPSKLQFIYMCWLRKDNILKLSTNCQQHVGQQARIYLGLRLNFKSTLSTATNWGVARDVLNIAKIHITV